MPHEYVQPVITGQDSLDEYIEDMCMMAAGAASGVWMQRHPTETMPVEEIVDVVRNMLREQNKDYWTYFHEKIFSLSY